MFSRPYSYVWFGDMRLPPSPNITTTCELGGHSRWTLYQPV